MAQLQITQKKLLAKDIQRNVHQVWQSYKVTENLSDEKKCLLKKQKGYDENHTILGVFGHIHETKRAIPILKAFAKIEKEFDNIDLVFVGKMAESI